MAGARYASDADTLDRLLKSEVHYRNGSHVVAVGGQPDFGARTARSQPEAR